MRAELPIIIGHIDRNSPERIRCAIAQYNGYTFLDVRTYTQAAGADGKPTKQIVAIRLHHLNDLRRLIDLAIAEAEKISEAEAA